jgi:RNA binding exosome subunit
VRLVLELNKDHAVQSVEISTIAHATDDLEKVQAALRTILPESLKERQLFTRKYMEGHHGNPIVTFDARLTKPAEVDEFASHFLSRLSKSEKLLIERDLVLHSDPEGNLYIRINKQQAFRGVVELGDEDPIRVRMKFNRLKGEAAKLMKNFLGSD